jgi:hypothetical protein
VFHTGNRGLWALLAESPYRSTTKIEGTQTSLVIDLESDRIMAAHGGEAAHDTT